MGNLLANHDPLLVLASYAVSVLGAFVGLYVASWVRTERGGIHFGWLTLASVVLGLCAIWAMHFIGMLAYRPGIPVTYEIAGTGLSVLVPIACIWAGLLVAFRWPGRRVALALAGVATGLGVASMHYTGMGAMRMAAEMTYALPVAALSVAIAIVASTAALYIAVHVRGAARHASAFVTGIAVCGMHYSGMAAMRLRPTGAEVEYFSGALTEQMMAILTVIAVFTACVIAIILVGARQVRDTLEVGTDIA